MKRSTILFGILTALVLCFIWGQSMLPHDVSAGESSVIVRWLKPILDPNGRVGDDTFHHLVRKAAHFTEYAALGFCMCGFMSSLPWKREKLRLPLTVVLCVEASSIDEIIQLFSEGRGARLSDVLLDSVGALFGIAVLLIINKIIHHHGEERP